jgi:hypothetical protein
VNGLHDLPGAPKDSIKTTINMDVTSEGKVGIEGGDPNSLSVVGGLFIRQQREQQDDPTNARAQS